MGCRVKHRRQWWCVPFSLDGVRYLLHVSRIPRPHVTVTCHCLVEGFGSVATVLVPSTPLTRESQLLGMPSEVSSPIPLSRLVRPLMAVCVRRVGQGPHNPAPPCRCVQLRVVNVSQPDVGVRGRATVSCVLHCVTPRGRVLLERDRVRRPLPPRRGSAVDVPAVPPGRLPSGPVAPAAAAVGDRGGQPGHRVDIRRKVVRAPAGRLGRRVTSPVLRYHLVRNSDCVTRAVSLELCYSDCVAWAV